MILVDANLLLYAQDTLADQHAAARAWWDEQLSGADPVYLCWPVLSAFLRIGTNPRLHRDPFTMKEACELVQRWLDQPCVRLAHPTGDHWTHFQAMLKEGHATGNLVSDAHLAALAIEHNCVLCSTDSDFARFSSLKWNNPLDAG